MIDGGKSNLLEKPNFFNKLKFVFFHIRLLTSLKKIETSFCVTYETKHIDFSC